MEATKPRRVHTWRNFGGEPKIISIGPLLYMFTRWAGRGIAMQIASDIEGPWSPRKIIIPSEPHSAFADGADVPGACYLPTLDAIALSMMPDPGFRRTAAVGGKIMRVATAVIDLQGHLLMGPAFALNPKHEWERPFIKKRTPGGRKIMHGGTCETDLVWDPDTATIPLFYDTLTTSRGGWRYRLCRAESGAMGVFERTIGPDGTNIVLDTPDLPHSYQGDNCPRHSSVYRDPESGVYYWTGLVQRPGRNQGWTTGVAVMSSKKRGVQGSWKWEGLAFDLERLNFPTEPMASNPRDKLGSPFMVKHKGKRLVGCDGDPIKRGDNRGLYVCEITGL